MKKILVVMSIILSFLASSCAHRAFSTKPSYQKNFLATVAVYFPATRQLGNATVIAKSSKGLFILTAAHFCQPYAVLLSYQRLKRQHPTAAKRLAANYTHALAGNTSTCDGELLFKPGASRGDTHAKLRFHARIVDFANDLMLAYASIASLDKDTKQTLKMLPSHPIELAKVDPSPLDSVYCIFTMPNYPMDRSPKVAQEGKVFGYIQFPPFYKTRLQTDMVLGKGASGSGIFSSRTHNLVGVMAEILMSNHTLTALRASLIVPRGTIKHLLHRYITSRNSHKPARKSLTCIRSRQTTMQYDMTDTMCNIIRANSLASKSFQNLVRNLI